MRHFFLLLLVTFAFAPLHGQTVTTSQVDRAQSLRDQGIVGAGSGMVAGPNEADLGEPESLRSGGAYKPFTVQFATPYFSTSNVELVPNEPRDDLVWAPAVIAVYQPRLAANLLGNFFVQQQFFHYNRLDNLDFGSLEARAGLAYTLPALHDLILRAEYGYSRLTTRYSIDEFFHQHSGIFNAELPFRFGESQNLSIGTNANISLEGHPDTAQRDTYDLFAIYAVDFTDAFSFVASGRIGYRDYRIGDRRDINETFAVSTHYRFAEWITGSLFSSFSANQSNNRNFDYAVFNLGGGFALTLKF